MKNNRIYLTLTLFIASVWLINGLVCKVLNLVPRHQEIVAAILGSDWAPTLTILIGIAEILMGIWVLSGIYKWLNAITQILLITIMNILEFYLVPDLLLWGKSNAIFAFLFILVIYYKEFFVSRRLTLQS